MVPTKERNVQAFYIEYKGEGILIDCGEGTQRQLNIMGKSRNKIKKILITHWHGDHVGGIAGLLHTLSNSEYKERLMIYGPEGTKKRLNHLMLAVDIPKNISIEVEELNPKGKLIKFFENDEYELLCIDMKHTTECLAYSFIEKDKVRIDMNKAQKLGIKEGPKAGELKRGKSVKIRNKVVKPEDVLYKIKGKKVTFIPDTIWNNNTIKIAENSDIIISESTYCENEKEKAEEYSHLTCEQAARIAQISNSKKLILVHFSQRYKELTEMLEEAKIIFPNTELGFDFMKIRL